MSKPRNWYDMTSDQRREWEKGERGREDLEYERNREREQAEADRARMRRERRAEQEAHAEELQSASDEAADLAGQVEELTAQRDALLPACEAALWALKGKEYDPDRFDAAAELCRAAIAKAKGE